MKKIVDARGLSCPQPVVLTKKALDISEIQEVITIVDNKTALENVSKLVNSMHFESNVDEKVDGYYIDILKGADLVEEEKQVSRGNTVILICSNLLGQGEAKLGNMLMKSFIYTLTQMEGELNAIIFMNSGVMLSTEGSELVEHIQVLESSGVEVLSCGTCLDFYNLGDKLKVGDVSNMYTITEKLMQASKVISV
ncbi:MAG: sulfurtransferase-like selenium metabolism protein YedF [Bacillota bacterium]|nr:sulfurtransferase-like selenium metabolism protein YedF [Bacillota bacterium]